MNVPTLFPKAAQTIAAPKAIQGRNEKATEVMSILRFSALWSAASIAVAAFLSDISTSNDFSAMASMRSAAPGSYPLITCVFFDGRQWARACRNRYRVEVDSLSIALRRLSPTISQAFVWSCTAVAGVNDLRSTLRVTTICAPLVMPFRIGLLLIIHRPYLSFNSHTIRPTLRFQVDSMEVD